MPWCSEFTKCVKSFYLSTHCSAEWGHVPTFWSMAQLCVRNPIQNLILVILSQIVWTSLFIPTHLWNYYSKWIGSYLPRSITNCSYKNHHKNDIELIFDQGSPIKEGNFRFLKINHIRLTYTPTTNQKLLAFTTFILLFAYGLWVY